MQCSYVILSEKCLCLGGYWCGTYNVTGTGYIFTGASFLNMRSTLSFISSVSVGKDGFVLSSLPGNLHSALTLSYTRLGSSFLRISLPAIFSLTDLRLKLFPCISSWKSLWISTATLLNGTLDGLPALVTLSASVHVPLAHLVQVLPCYMYFPLDHLSGCSLS